MGTNYYWNKTEKPPCTHCGRPYLEEPIHIGKSSGGWCFSLHVTDEIKSLDDWKIIFESDGVIKNEYGEEITPESMLSIIMDRASNSKLMVGEPPYQYSSWEEFMNRNDAEPGPNNLLRHRISEYCVGHGEGTWDLCPGEFS